MNRTMIRLFWVCFFSITLLACLSDENGGLVSIDGDLDAIAADGDAESFDEEDETDGDEGELEGETEHESEAEVPWSNDPFRFVVISDTHLMLGNSAENNRKFMEAGPLFAEMNPAVEFVVSTGDNIEDLFCVPDVTCSDPLPILELYRDLIDSNYALPFYIVLGNHDDRYLDSFLDKQTPLRSWNVVFGDSGYLPAPYYQVVRNGFNFIMLDATDLAHDHESNDLPSFGDQQLSWLRAELDKGLPSVLFWHHFIQPPADDGETDNPLLAIIKDYKDVVKATFSGHHHRFGRSQWQGVWFYQTENFGKNENMPYHLVECDPTSGSITIANENDIDYYEEIHSSK